MVGPPGGARRMKRSELEGKPVKDLGALALRLGVRKPSLSNKADLIEEILAAGKLSDARRTSPRAPAAGGNATPTRSKLFRPARRRPQKASSPARQPGAAPSARRPRAEPKAATPTEPGAPSPLFEHKFETPTHPIPAGKASPYDNLGELPEGYGTGRLFLTARDPYWLYAYWDYTWPQLEEMRRAARHGELKLRMHAGRDSGAPIQQELTLNPAARNWFIQVDRASTDYYAEFGYYDHQGNFITTSRSYPVRTPADRPSSRTDARFVTIPFHIRFHELFEMVKAYFKDGEELADVLHRLQLDGFPFPFDYERMAVEEGVLEDVFGKDLFRRIRMGSEVVTEWFQRRLREEQAAGLFSMSSPFGASFGAPTSRGFWFNVNAELVVYGATEPNARVVFDGKKIALKQDGTFRFQFALPDGSYDVPIAATSGDQAETRRVALHFERNTSEGMGVGEVPHAEGLVALRRG